MTTYEGGTHTMIKLMSTNGQIQYDHDEYIVDSVDDLKQIPKRVAMGSIALIIATGDVYMKDSSGEWVKL